MNSYHRPPISSAYHMPREDANMVPPFNGVPNYVMYPQAPVPPGPHPYIPQAPNMYGPPPPAAYPGWRNEDVAVPRNGDRDNFGYYGNPPACNPPARDPLVRSPPTRNPLAGPCPRTPSRRRRSLSVGNRTDGSAIIRGANHNPDNLASGVDSLTLDIDDPFDNDVIIAPGGSARITVRIQGEQPQTAVFHVCGRTMGSHATRWSEVQGVDFEANDAKAIDAMYIVLHLVHMTPWARVRIPATVQATTLAWVCYDSLVFGMTQTTLLHDHTANWARQLRSPAYGNLLASKGDWLFALYVGWVMRDRALCRTAAETMLVRGTVDSKGYWRDNIGRRLELLPDPMYRKVGMYLRES